MMYNISMYIYIYMYKERRPKDNRLMDLKIDFDTPESQKLLIA